MQNHYTADQHVIYLDYFPQFVELMREGMERYGFVKRDEYPAFHRQVGTVRHSLIFTLKDQGKSLKILPFFAVVDEALLAKCKEPENIAKVHLLVPFSVLVGNNEKQTPGGRRPGAFDWRAHSPKKVELAAQEILEGVKHYALPIWDRFQTTDDVFRQFEVGTYVFWEPARVKWFHLVWEGQLDPKETPYLEFLKTQDRDVSRFFLRHLCAYAMLI